MIGRNVCKHAEEIQDEDNEELLRDSLVTFKCFIHYLHNLFHHVLSNKSIIKI